MIIGGGLAGLISAQLAIPFSGKTVAGSTGTWRSFQSGDQPQPYQRAHYLLNGRLPPPRALIFEIETAEDSSGSALDGDCTYALTLAAQTRRWWRIEADAGGERIAETSSHAVLQAADWRVLLTLSPSPQPGNWLSPRTTGGYRVIYAVALDDADASGQPALPVIKRLECQ